MKVFSFILLVIIIVAVIYSFVVWVAGEVEFEKIFSRPGASVKENSKENSSVRKPRLSAEKKEGGDVIVKFNKPSGLQKDIPAGFTAADLSPDFGKVKITSVRRPTRLGKGGGFTLQADFTLNELLDITNWKIKSNTGEIVIRGGVFSVPPVNLQRIILRSRTAAVFYADQPSFVKNIELNKCTGYLNNAYNFNPRLPNNCPRPARNETISFRGECQSFIRSLSSCEMPTAEELNRFTNPADVACHKFLTSLNYQNCFNLYSKDSDFYSYGWRVWIAERLPFDSIHDRLLLFDKDNLLVDEYIY